MEHCNGNHHDGDEEIEFFDMFMDDLSKLKSLVKMTQIRKALNQAEIANKVNKYLDDPSVNWTTSLNVLKW